MAHDVNISQCSRFLKIDLTDSWDDDSLRSTILQTRGLQKIHGTSLILIETQTWLNDVANMDSVLTLGEVFSNLSECNWKIAIVTAYSNNHNTILENMLTLKDITLQHFDSTANAEAWLLQ